MEIPVIDLEGLSDNLKSETMELLHQACENWGFFQVTNHGINVELMDKVIKLVNLHYEECMKRRFYESEMAKGLESRDATAVDSDWESSYFIWHRPKAKFDESINLSDELGKVMDEYINQVIKLAEKLSRAHLNCRSFSRNKKVSKYPQCDRPELVTGLRAHTDAGGIILLLQDDQVPGLEFLKDGKWVEIPNGSRLSIATFYNPAPDALISPASELLYPNQFQKGPRFETMKKMTSGQCSLPA
ncbi:hypothetical protein MKW92_050568 [Papaver armeniacum]|nr:hypothetical protein MKW92_050568 [Papaver armeniacum]